MRAELQRTVGEAASTGEPMDRAPLAGVQQAPGIAGRSDQHGESGATFDAQGEPRLGEIALERGGIGRWLRDALWPRHAPTTPWSTLREPDLNPTRSIATRS